MFFANSLGLVSDGVIDAAPTLAAAPSRLVPCLASRRACITDVAALALVVDDVSSGLVSGRAWAIRVFYRCLGEFSVGRGGLLSSTLAFFLIGLARPYRFWRIAVKLPSRGQRSRSNSKTSARLDYEGINEAFALLGIARMAVGREAGASVHRQRIRAKLKPKVVKASTSKRKAPVVRTRDTKKSAWR